MVVKLKPLHRGCVTPKQLANLNEMIEGNFDYLDGYDEITPELQEKVKIALEQGHVDDSDWKGVSTENLTLVWPDTHAVSGCGIQQAGQDRHAEADTEEEGNRRRGNTPCFELLLHICMFECSDLQTLFSTVRHCCVCATLCA